MKFWTAAAIAAALALGACSQPAETPPPPAPAVTIEAPSGEYTLDPHHASLTARVMHLGLARYTLRFTGVSGTLNFDAEAPAQSSVNITVAANTLDTPYSGERDFDAELQNSEWLDAAAFPTATFRSTSVEVTGPNTGRMTGDLTLHGVTKPVTFDVVYNGSWRQHPMGMPISGIGFSATGTIRRSEFGISKYLPPAGSSVGISDEVELLIDVEFNRPIEPAPGTPAPAQPAEPVN